MTVDRRAASLILFFGIARGLALTSEAAAQGGSANVQWVLSRQDLGILVDSLKFEGEIKPDTSKGTDTRGLPIIYILIGIVALPHLAEALLTLYQRSVGAGIVVQDTGRGLLIKRDPAVPSDIMIVKDKRGIEVKSIRQFPNASVISDALKAVVEK